MKKTIKNIINKHCELCGKKVENPYYSTIFSLDYLIFAKNENVINIDHEKRRAFFSNGKSLEYTSPLDRDHQDVLAHAYRSNEHLLCSEQCEDNFVKSPRMLFGKSVFNGDSGPLFDFHNQESPIFFPMVVGGIKCTFNKCDVCGESYPAFGRNWTERKIIKKYKVRGRDNEVPDISSFDIKEPLVLSGLSDRKPEGYLYAYQIDDVVSKRNLCSFDCGYFLAQKNNSVVFVDSVLEKDRLGVIVSETEEFNRDLQNNIIHRPSFVSQL